GQHRWCAEAGGARREEASSAPQEGGGGETGRVHDRGAEGRRVNDDGSGRQRYCGEERCLEGCCPEERRLEYRGPEGRRAERCSSQPGPEGLGLAGRVSPPRPPASRVSRISANCHRTRVTTGEARRIDEESRGTPLAGTRIHIRTPDSRGTRTCTGS